MECRNCGKALRNGAKFCSACGMPTNKPIIRYEDYDSCRDIFSDTSMIPSSPDAQPAPAAEPVRPQQCFSEPVKPQQNYSERVNSMIHGTAPVNKVNMNLRAPQYGSRNYGAPLNQAPCGAAPVYTANARVMQQNGYNYGNVPQAQPSYPEINTGSAGKQEKKHRHAGLYAGLLEKPFKKVVVDMTALLMGVTIIAATLVFAVNYINQASSAEASTAEYYELETEEFTSYEADEIVTAEKKPELADIGFDSEGKRYAVSGIITGIERNETYTAVKLSYDAEDYLITLIANFESSKADDTKNMKVGQETCITGVLDIDNEDGTAVAYLNYAECDV